MANLDTNELMRDRFGQAVFLIISTVFISFFVWALYNEPIRQAKRLEQFQSQYDNVKVEVLNVRILSDPNMPTWNKILVTVKMQDGKTVSLQQDLDKTPIIPIMGETWTLSVIPIDYGYLSLGEKVK